MLDLYKNIKKYRAEKGWTQKEFADKLGYKDRTMISKIEKGQVDLSLAKIFEISKLFGIEASELMGEVDIPEDEIEIARIEREKVRWQKKYNQLTDEHKLVVNNMIDQLLNLQK